MKTTIALLSLLLVAAGCTPIIPAESEKLAVVASFYPIGEFARQVGGSLVHVTVVTPAGTEPHDYEPTAKDVATVYASDILLYNGGGVDVWADKVSIQAAKNDVAVVEMSSAIDTLPVGEDVEDAAMPFDPHFWLDPTLAEREVELIRDTFSKADPSNANTYAANARKYADTLTQLHESFTTGLRSCENRTVVTSHAAFAYLADRYGFDVVSISGLSPEEEPSAGRIAEITALAKAQKIKYIYFETLVSPKLAQTVAEEIGAQPLVFNPLEGLTQEEVAAGANYVSVMEDNLTNLRIGMMCE